MKKRLVKEEEKDKYISVVKRLSKGSRNFIKHFAGNTTKRIIEESYLIGRIDGYIEGKNEK